MFFSTQNTRDKNNPIHYAYEVGCFEQYALSMLTLIKKLLLIDQYTILRQVNAKNQNIFELVALSKNRPIIIELIHMLGHFPPKAKMDCFGEFYSQLDAHFLKTTNIEDKVVLLESIERAIFESNQEEVLISSKKMLEENQQNILYALFKRWLEKTPIPIKNYILCDAIKNTNQAYIQEILKYGVEVIYINPETTTKNVQSPLDLALSSQQFDLVSILITEYPTELNEFQLHSLCTKLANYKLQTLKQWLFEKYSEKLPVIIKNQLLSEAIGTKNLDLAMELVIKGADVNYKDPILNKGMLVYAVEMDLLGLTKLLIAKHSAPLSDTELEFITLHIQQIELILQLNTIYPNTLNCSLYAAVSNNNKILVEELLSLGANPSMKKYCVVDLILNSMQYDFLPMVLRYLNVEIKGNVRALIYSKEVGKSLSWNKLEYLLDKTFWQNNALFATLIKIQLHEAQWSHQTKELVQLHAQASFNYLISHPKNTKEVHCRKIFLNRILFENFNTEEELKTEIRNYMNGTTVYNPSCLSLFSSVKSSRVAYAYNQGLFGPHIKSFENLTRKEKKSVFLTFQ